MFGLRTTDIYKRRLKTQLSIQFINSLLRLPVTPSSDCLRTKTQLDC